MAVTLRGREFACWTCDSCNWGDTTNKIIICRGDVPDNVGQQQLESPEREIAEGTLYWCHQYQKTFREVPPIPTTP